MRHFEHTAAHVARLALMLVICFGCLISFERGGRASSFVAADPLISFEPLQRHVRPGDLCTLQVVVDDAVDSLSCMNITISLDTSYAECTTALQGKLYEQKQFPTFFRWSFVAPDTVNALDCVLGVRSYVIAPGELTRFVFKAKRNGICRVSFTKTRLFDIDRNEVSHVNGQYAEIIVGTQSGDGPEVPGSGALYNYPNPFNPSTVLVLVLPQSPGEPGVTPAAVDIFSASGSRVRSLFRGAMPGGKNELAWNGNDDFGRYLAAGVYFAIAQTKCGALKRKMILVR